MKRTTNIFSIIIPSYNSINTIKYTIDSIQQQNPELIHEVIIVDSSESNDVMDYITSLKNKKFKIIKSGIRVMPAIQRNIGAKKAKGKILLFIDSDVILLEGYLERIFKSYCEGKKTGGGAIVLPNFQRNIKIAIAQYYLQLNEFLPYGKDRKKRCIPGCNIYCDNKTFFKAGCFPIIRASEDTQFCYNVNKISEVWFIPKAKIAHIFREDTESFKNNQKMLGYYIGLNKNAKHIFIYRTSLLKLLIPIIITMKLMIISYRLFLAGCTHLNKTIKNSPLIFKGHYYWTLGFIEGYQSRISKD
ncbi:MAG TPA: glycosyltransferase family 2 protein [Spirochaetota bacterium]|nr:glycosyltransferase family 2 protein [Spirochaetota bacterium]